MKYLIILICLLFISCSCVEECEAHQIMGNAYIPMLKDYINKDTNIDKDLKPIYGLALDRWLELINEKQNK